MSKDDKQPHQASLSNSSDDGDSNGYDNDDGDDDSDEEGNDNGDGDGNDDGYDNEMPMSYIKDEKQPHRRWRWQ